jgi:hypothetical protein
MSKVVANILLASILTSTTCAIAQVPAKPPGLQQPANTDAQAASATSGNTGSPPAATGGSTLAASPPAADQKTDISGALSREKPSAITALLDSSGVPGAVGLNDKLLVQVRTATSRPIEQLEATQYALILNGKEVKGLPDPTYDKSHQSLIFELKRNGKNKDLWTALLGSPSPMKPTREVTVGLGENTTDTNASSQHIITGTNRSDTLQLKVFGPYRLGIASLLIAGVIWLVFARARKNTTLRDGLIPQIAPEQQTYSLARCQMAFWFVLVFCSFILLYIVTWDYNTVSQQALILMGISGTTALAAVVIDQAKDSPADAVNRGLQALGFHSYDDVRRLREYEIPSREMEIAGKPLELASLPKPPADAPPPPLTPQQQQWAATNARVTQLKIEINDRKNRLSTYEDKIGPFKTQGFFKDITTDINGTAIHRLQIFCWTLVLGGIYVVGVYRDLAMPEFGGTLLALMGISGAGYVGFKFPEKNS